MRYLLLQVDVPENAKGGLYPTILNAVDKDDNTRVDSIRAIVYILQPADVWPMFHYEDKRTGRSVFEGTETAALLICETNPKISSFGNSPVIP